MLQKGNVLLIERQGIQTYMCMHRYACMYRLLYADRQVVNYLMLLKKNRWSLPKVFEYFEYRGSMLRNYLRNIGY